MDAKSIPAPFTHPPVVVSALGAAARAPHIQGVFVVHTVNLLLSKEKAQLEIEETEVVIIVVVDLSVERGGRKIDF